MKNIELIIKKQLKNLVESTTGQENYMFFENLKQIHRQCEILLEMDPNTVDNILQDGHDWADDHVSEAKNNMDQVFDFLMNETERDGMEMSMNFDNEDIVMSEGKTKKNKPTNPDLWQQSLDWARQRYEVCPSAYCNGAAAKRYKSKGGKWRKG